MSFETVRDAINLPDLAPLERLLLIRLADRDGPGGSWPTVPKLAKFLRVSDRTVQRHLNKLVARGLVDVELKAGGPERMRADRRPNLYHLAIPATLDSRRGDTAVTSYEVTRGDTAVTPLRAHEVTRGDTGDAHEVTPVSPQKKKQSLETIHDDDRAKTPPRPAQAVPSSSSVNHSDGIHSLVDQAVRRLAVIEHRQHRTGWAAGVKRNWRAERDAEGWTRYDKAAVWLEAGIERATVVEKVIRDDLLTGPPEPELAPSTLFDEVIPTDPAYTVMPASLERVDELLAAAGLGDRYRSRKNPNPPL